MARKKMMFIAFAILLLFPCLSIIKFLMYNKNSISSLFLKLPDAHCKQDPPFLVLLVTTTHTQKKQRKAIRTTWGKEQIILGKRVVTYFLLGSSTTTKDDFISEEFTTYKDFIQKDFHDTYYNLTLKTIMGVEWISAFCPQTHYVMKTDTDMFVNVFYLVELLLRKNQTTNLFTGVLRPNDNPIRDVNSKWYISEEEYKGNKYPPFCSGTGYVFSLDVAQRIYDISFSVPFFKLEDVYVGMCLDKLNITLQPLHDKSVFFAGKYPFSVCGIRNLVTSHGVEPYEMVIYWEVLHKPQEEKC